MNLLHTEMRRALHRRVVRVLVLLALIGCVLAGIGVFLDAAGQTVIEMRANPDTHAAIASDWAANGDDGDNVLLITAFFLFLGGLFAGASVTGAEWRFGTVTTVLTWEPRRVRLLGARLASGAILAFVIAIALQAIFLASLLPAVLTHGSTDRIDGAWWGHLLTTGIRVALVTAVAAVLGMALANLGRNTAFALVVAFAWVAVVENLVRGLTPWEPYLLMENLITVLTWDQLDDADFIRSAPTALLTLIAYLAALLGATFAVFNRRDVAGSS